MRSKMRLKSTSALLGSFDSSPEEGVGDEDQEEMDDDDDDDDNDDDQYGDDQNQSDLAGNDWGENEGETVWKIVLNLNLNVSS